LPARAGKGWGFGRLGDGGSQAILASYARLRVGQEDASDQG
jgi:hypothetical protein